MLLEGGLVLGLDVAGLPGLLVDLREERLQLHEGVVAQAGLLDALVLQFKFAEQLGVVNEEDGARVGYFGPRHHFEQPLGGLEFLRVVPELPGRHYFEGNVPGAADLEEAIARDGVEGLNAAVEQHGQAAELTDVVFFFRLGEHDGDDLGSEGATKNQGMSLKRSSCGVLRLTRGA